MPRKRKTEPKPKMQEIILQVAAPSKPKRVAWNKGKKCPSSKLTPEMRKHIWKKGQSGNPKGKPKGTGEKVLSKAYVVRLEEKCDLAGLEHLTWAEAISLGLSRAAARGETGAAKEIREATEGKLPEHLRVGDPEGNPLTPPAFNVQFVGPKK